MYKNNTNAGFTLIELLVVISIIGVLSSMVLASLNSSRAKARDVRRKQDLIQISNALQLYYIDNNGSYPLANPGAWGGATTGPCGPGNSNTYISGLVPTYIKSLPIDPNATAPCTGYLYNSDGTNYALLVHQSYEGVYPTANEKFYDPVRPTWALKLCSGGAACTVW